MPFLEPPAVDDVADQIERLAIDVVEEVDQQIGIAAAGAEVDVADPHGAIAAALADDAFGHMRLGREGIGKAGRYGQRRDRGHVALLKAACGCSGLDTALDRKSTRLNSSH